MAVQQSAFGGVPVLDTQRKTQVSGVSQFGGVPIGEVVTPNIEDIQFYNEQADTINAFKEDEITYDGLLENDTLRQTAIRFAQNHLGYDETVTPEVAIEDTIEHFRKFSVNELTAGLDFNYVSGLKADGKEQELNDYRTMFTAYEALPFFWSEGAAPNALGDYLEGLVKAPSTYLGLILPAYGKAAGKLAVEGTKQGIIQILKTPISSSASAMARNPIKTAIAGEVLAGVGQDVAAQNTLIEANIQRDYSALQTVGAGVISAAPFALVPLVVKRGIVYNVEKDTKDIVKITQKKLKEKNDLALKTADVTMQKNMKLSERVKKELKILDANVRELDPDQVARGKKYIDGISEYGGIEQPLTLAIKPESYNQTVGALTELLAMGGGLKRGERITEGVSRVIRTLRVNKEPKVVEEQFAKLLEKYNLTYDALGDLVIADVSDAARRMQAFGQAKRNLKNNLAKLSNQLDDLANYDIFGFDKELKDKIEKLATSKTVDKDGNVISEMDRLSRIQDLDRYRLASMTSQVGTTVRNTLSGVSRVGSETLVRAFDNGLRSVVGIKIQQANPIKGTEKLPDAFSDALLTIYGLANKKESDAVKTIFEMGFEKEASKLFRELADIGPTTKGENKLTRLQAVSRELNALNTISDNMFKRAALTANLKRELNILYTRALQEPAAFKKKFGRDPKAEDFNLVEIMLKGRFNEVFGSKAGKDALKRSVQEALYFTYQQTPDGKTRTSSLAKGLINAVHSAPFILTNLMPFPRFVINALRFTYEHSVFNVGAYEDAFRFGKDVYKSRVKGEFIDPSVIGRGGTLFNRQIREGSYEQLAKGVYGVAFTGAALAFRMSEHAGERWYEGKTKDGRTYDLRPMFPLAPYLFVADMIARSIKGEPVFQNARIAKDALQALTGTQFRAGLGLYVLDKALEDVANESNWERANQIAAQGVGNILQTFSMPTTILQDTYNTFFAPDTERIIRDTNSKDFLSLVANVSLSRLPANVAIQEKLEDILGKDRYEAPPPLRKADTGDVLRRTTPISRQTFGVLYREKRNEFQKELERLKILPSRLVRRTRNPKLNELNSLIMSEFSVGILLPYVKSDEYKNIKDVKDEKGEVIISKAQLQRQLLLDKITKLKDGVSEMKENIVGEGREPIEESKFEQLPFVYKTMAINVYKRIEGNENLREDDYDYSLLLSIGKQLKRQGLESITRMSD